MQQTWCSRGYDGSCQSLAKHNAFYSRLFSSLHTKTLYIEMLRDEYHALALPSFLVLTTRQAIKRPQAAAATAAAFLGAAASLTSLVAAANVPIPDKAGAAAAAAAAAFARRGNRNKEMDRSISCYKHKKGNSKCT